MLLRVKRGIGFNSRVLKLGDHKFARGEVVDTSTLDFTSEQWDTWKAHRLVEEVDVPDEHRAALSRRQKTEMRRAERLLASMPADELPEGVGVQPETKSESAPVNIPAATVLSCPACDFVARTPHGLTVHRGRKHKE